LFKLKREKSNPEQDSVELSYYSPISKTKQAETFKNKKPGVE
jgi:hypothetical protein